MTFVSPYDFDMDLFRVSDFDNDHEKYKGHVIAHPQYDDKECLFRIPPFVLTQECTGPISHICHPHEENLCLRFPLDPSQTDCDLIKLVYDKIDEYMKVNVGSKLEYIYAKKNMNATFRYSPIIKKYADYTGFMTSPCIHHFINEWTKNHIFCSCCPPDDDHGFDFWKAKLDVDRDTGKIKTNIIILSPSRYGHFYITTKINVDHYDDLLKYLTLGSTIEMVLEGIIFSNKHPSTETFDGKNVYEYHLRFKIKTIYILSKEQYIIEDNELSNDQFDYEISI